MQIFKHFFAIYMMSPDDGGTGEAEERGLTKGSGVPKLQHKMIYAREKGEVLSNKRQID